MPGHFAEPIIAAVSAAATAVLKLALRLLLLCARPWRYATSAGFREQFDAHHAGRPAVFKWLALAWGWVVLAGGLALAYGAVGLAAGVFA